MPLPIVVEVTMVGEVTECASLLPLPLHPLLPLLPHLCDRTLVFNACIGNIALPFLDMYNCVWRGNHV